MQALNLPFFDLKIIDKGGKRYIFDVIRRKYVTLTPEEWVRQHFVNYLITEKKFPPQLIANEIQIKLNNTRKRCDTVVYNRSMNPMIIVEYKAPTIPINKEVFEQIVRYNMSLHVKFLIVSNGLNHYCCVVDYSKNIYTFLNSIPLWEECI